MNFVKFGNRNSLGCPQSFKNDFFAPKDRDISSGSGLRFVIPTICSMESVFRFSAKSITSFSLLIRNPLRRFSGGGGSGAAKSKRIKIRATYLIKDSVY